MDELTDLRISALQRIGARLGVAYARNYGRGHEPDLRALIRARISAMRDAGLPENVREHNERAIAAALAIGRK